MTLAAAAAGLLVAGPEQFFGLVFVVVMLAQAEFYRAVRRAGHDPAVALGLVAGVMLMLTVYKRGEGGVPLILVALFACSFLWHRSLDPRRNVLAEVGITMLGVAYIPLLGSFAGLLALRDDGRGVILVTLAAVAAYDVFAFAGGSLVGRTALAPKISPNKTWEGAAIATLATIAVTLALGPWLGPWSPRQSAILGAVIALVAPVGDLMESMIKRDLGIKDMGSIIPGHGGALDRIDAMLLAVPASYFSLELFGL
ncbi:MAG: phosphatidate cytidylyltransferase [Actinomycetota bacterium]|nr:phosphatidate cytidylyltransferase [Actinomycetota bacterium]